MEWLNPWLVGSLILFAVWLFLFVFLSSLRKEMLIVSFVTSLAGLTEPLFVPSYWQPPSLFNLATTIGFDIESILFCFSIGGIAPALTDFLMEKFYTDKKRPSHFPEYYLFLLILPILLFFHYIFLQK